MSLLGLEGKVVLVTGAAAGIGAATAALFAEAGATLALCDRAEGFGETDDPIRRTFDVRDAAATRAFVDTVAAQHGRIDVVVNNAGGTFAAPFLDVSPNREAALVAENFTQVTTLVRAAVPYLPEGGCIVNVTSIEAHRAAPLYAVYAAMKAAQANLTQTLALELAPRGIRVNAVSPGPIVTEAFLEVLGVSDQLDELARTVPLGRLGAPDDIAAAVVYLASPAASWVTGQNLLVAGGRTERSYQYEPRAPST